jgi:hypothetical protein
VPYQHHRLDERTDKRRCEEQPDEDVPEVADQERRPGSIIKPDPILSIPLRWGKQRARLVRPPQARDDPPLPKSSFPTLGPNRLDPSFYGTPVENLATLGCTRRS